jgi:biopolymer transport protein TolQ
LRTFGLYVLALQGQAAGAPEAGASSSIVDLVARSSPLSKAVLLILVLFSVVSWAITLFKYWQFRRVGRQSATFLDVFRKSSKFSEVQAVSRTLAESPLTGIFLAGYAELNAQLRHAGGAAAPDARPQGAAARPTLKSLEALDRALLRAAGVEVNKLERRVPFLATTASITPFIGLFGTVWGILTAFQNIGATGSTSLGVVALPIAEALIATAAGLAAAIPAVYFYNDLTHRVKLLTAEMEDFSLEFLNIAERNFT